MHDQYLYFEVYKDRKLVLACKHSKKNQESDLPKEFLSFTLI